MINIFLIRNLLASFNTIKWRIIEQKSPLVAKTWLLCIWVVLSRDWRISCRTKINVWKIITKSLSKFTEMKHGTRNLISVRFLLAPIKRKFHACKLFIINLHISVFPARLWFYQTCTEYGYYQTTNSRRSVFGTLFPLPYFTGLCTDLYGY